MEPEWLLSGPSIICIGTLLMVPQLSELSLALCHRGLVMQCGFCYFLTYSFNKTLRKPRSVTKRFNHPSPIGAQVCKSIHYVLSLQICAPMGGDNHRGPRYETKIWKTSVAKNMRHQEMVTNIAKKKLPLLIAKTINSLPHKKLPLFVPQCKTYGISNWNQQMGTSK